MTIQTKLKPEEAIKRILGIVGDLHGHSRRHSTGNIEVRVQEDLKMFEDDEALKNLVSKLDYASIQQILEDAARLSKIASDNPQSAHMEKIKELLKETEDLFEDIRKAEIGEIKSAKFLARMANHLAHKVHDKEVNVKRMIKNIERHNRQIQSNHPQKRAA